MDLSKAFDCLPNDLVLPKLEAYDLDRNTLKVIYSYLTNRKQTVKMKGFVGIIKLIISCVPQESILGPILFNLFINDLFYFTDSENLHNFADDNTSDHADSINELVDKLELPSAKAIEWMSNNHMIVNPSKFHAIILTKNPKGIVKTVLNIEEHLTKHEAEVDLLGIRIDQRLSFSRHISNICRKAAKELNALSDLVAILVSP